MKSSTPRLLPQPPPGLERITETHKGETYVSTGFFEPGAERKFDQCAGVTSLFFDCDGADFAAALYFDEAELASMAEDLGLPAQGKGWKEKVAKKALQQDAYAECLDEVLDQLEQEATTLLTAFFGHEPTKVAISGYGLHYHYWLHGGNPTPCKTARKYVAAAITHMNEQAGYALFDPKVKDQGSRLCRDLGTANNKGESPKDVELVFDNGTILKLADVVLPDPPKKDKKARKASSTDDGDAVPGAGYKHIDLGPGTQLANDDYEGIDLYTLPAEPDDYEKMRRVYCPFHDGASGAPSAFIARYKDHWTLVCPSCETVWHASKKLADALALNEHLVYIETLDRVYDLAHREFLSTEVIKRRGLGYRTWMNKDFDEYRRRAVGLEFFPDIPSNGRYNTYDPDVVMKPTAELEDCPELLERLLDNLVSDDDEWYYLVQWLGYKIRHPDSGSQVALIFQGAQGTGKGLLFKLLERIWSKYVVQVDGAALESDFNGFLHEKLLVVGNEVGSDFFRDKRRAATKLKGWVVGDNLRINMKNIREFQVRNPTSWILCSNDNVPIVIDAGDRRYTVLQSKTPLREADPELIPLYLQALKDPNFVQDVVNFLHTVDLSDFDHAMPLENVARAEVQKSSLQSHDLWWDDECPPDGTYPVDLVYKEYSRWAKEEQGERSPTKKVVFGQNLPPGVTRDKVRPNALPGRLRAHAGRADKVRVYIIDRGKEGVWTPPALDCGGSTHDRYDNFRTCN